jgi:NTE family protein
VLATLLPHLEQRDELPGLVLGTSIGSLNSTHLAATAHLPAEQSVSQLLQLWRDVQFSDIIGPLLSAREITRLLLYVGGLLGIPQARTPALLDTTPLPGLLSRMVDFPVLGRNIDEELVALAVVATSYATGQSVVFHDGPAGVSVPTDIARGIRYVPTRIDSSHIIASASIPVAFPATRVETPADAAGWYGDGGTRLNTPLKPALKLGAKRVIVVGLDSNAPPHRPNADRPDLFDGAGLYTQALFADPLAQDVVTLARNNVELLRLGAGDPARDGPGLIPYIFIAPRDGLEIGRVAADTFAKHLSGPAAWMRAPDLMTLGSLVGAGRSAARGVLFSLLFFATEFHSALIDLGQSDARRWLETSHDDGPWRLGPPPLPQAPPPPPPRPARAPGVKRPRASSRPAAKGGRR